MKNWIKILPLFIVEWLAKKYCDIDSFPSGTTWYRVCDAREPLKGAGILIRRT